MVYILDAGKAITCSNLIRQANPCMNVYCQSCIIAFMEEKLNYEDAIEEKKAAGEETDKEKEEQAKKLKELEQKKTRRKLWLKASQNVLFTCPCCQGHCLEEDLV